MVGAYGNQVAVYYPNNLVTQISTVSNSHAFESSFRNEMKREFMPAESRVSDVVRSP